MIRYALLFALLPFAAIANPMAGIWTYQEGMCSSVLEDTGDAMPIRITKSEFQFYESTCEITAIEDATGLNTWKMDLECHGEGETWSEGYVFLYSGGDTAHIWYGEGEPIPMYLCGR